MTDAHNIVPDHAPLAVPISALVLDPKPHRLTGYIGRVGTKPGELD